MRSGQYSRKRPGENSGPGNLSAERQKLIAGAKGDKVQKLNLLAPDEHIEGEIERLGLTTVVGKQESLLTRPLRDKSKLDYDADIKAFDRFLQLVGAHEDRIILVDRPPQFSPPVHPRRIVQYLRKIFSLSFRRSNTWM
jgi:hypothetical protein